MKEIWFYLRQYNDDHQVTSSCYYDTFEQDILDKHADKYAIQDALVMKGYYLGR